MPSHTDLDGQMIRLGRDIIEEMLWRLVEDDYRFDDRFAVKLKAACLDANLEVTDADLDRIVTAAFGTEEDAGDFPFEIDVSIIPPRVTTGVTL